MDKDNTVIQKVNRGIDTLKQNFTLNGLISFTNASNSFFKNLLDTVNKTNYS